MEIKPHNENNFCRPSELPIYTPNNYSDESTNSQVQKSVGELENIVKGVRVTFTKYVNEFVAYKRVGVDHFNHSMENLDWLIDYLRKEENMLPKAGAIGIGGLTGLIFGLRGGFFKKTIYATTGAMGMAAICYPKEASEYSKVGLAESKKYLTIAYNFAYGVKKDDTPLELPSIPSVPKSFSELWESVKSSGSSLLSDKHKTGDDIGKNNNEKQVETS